MILALLVAGLLQQVERVDRDDACIKCHVDQAEAVKGTLHQAAEVGCVSCHGADEIQNGKHRRIPGFRSGRLPQIAALCGSCHEAVLEAFKASEHFLSASRDPAEAIRKSSCSACHEYHRTPPADRRKILVICSGCHEAESPEYRGGAAMFGEMDGLEQAIARLDGKRRGLERKAGISLFATGAHLEEARRARTRLRIAQHGLDWPRLMPEVAASADRAGAAYHSLDREEAAFVRRRALGLGLFLALLVASAALVWRKARALHGGI
jgi:cytochrome c553